MSPHADGGDRAKTHHARTVVRSMSVRLWYLSLEVTLAYLPVLKWEAGFKGLEKLRAQSGVSNQLSQRPATHQTRLDCFFFFCF